MSALVCPHCGEPLRMVRTEIGRLWHCADCDGRAATIPLLRRRVQGRYINRLWQDARASPVAGLGCPGCRRPMRRVYRGPEATTELDLCLGCHVLWLDRGEAAVLPIVPPEPGSEEAMDPRARQALAMLRVESLREKDRLEHEMGPPETAWQTIAGMLGLPVEDRSPHATGIPLVTIGIGVLMIAATLWLMADPKGALPFLLYGDGVDRWFGLTFVTSFFLHAGVGHLVGNLYFLMVFGDDVEEWLGKLGYVALVALSALCGDLAHLFFDPQPDRPSLGASGGISGILAYYALAFPRVRIRLCFRWLFWLSMPAWGGFLLWCGFQVLITWQQMSGQGNLSGLAHLGGVAGGVVAWWLTRSQRPPALGAREGA